MTMKPYALATTFMDVPHATELGAVKAVILGLPFDCGTHPVRVGSRLGPAAIREQSRMLRPYDTRTGIDPLTALGVLDVGDARVVPGEIAPTQEGVFAAVRQIAGQGVVPVTLGGDGALALPQMRALHAVHRDLVTVHIDAHTDAYDLPGFNTATSFARAAEEGVVDTERSFQIGMRGSIMVPGAFEHAAKLGYHVVPMEELMERGLAETFARVRDVIGRRPVYLCFDMDFFDPSVAPGVCTPTWGGASAREGLAALEACGGLQIVGIDINTVSPPHDVGGMTAHLAATVALRALHMLARHR